MEKRRKLKEAKAHLQAKKAVQASVRVSFQGCGFVVDVLNFINGMHIGNSPAHRVVLNDLAHAGTPFSDKAEVPPHATMSTSNNLS